jgi:hypothetical protein
VGDGQGIVIGDMEDPGYVSVIMRVKGLVETTETVVVHSEWWCLIRALGIFLERSLGGITGQFRDCFLGKGILWKFNVGGGTGMGGRRWDVEVKGVCDQPKSSIQSFKSRGSS